MTEFFTLGRLTLRNPSAAAQIVLAQHWRGEALWTGLFLVAVLNALAYAVMTVLFPVPEEMAFLNPSPILYMALSTGVLLVFSSAVTVSGRMIGGQGGFFEVLSMMVWLQVVRLALQVVLIFAIVLSPGLGGLLSLAVNLYLVYVLLHFVNEGHRFASLWRAFGVLLMASLLALFALTFVLGLFGPDNLGLPAYV
ncbi:Yip1 family protein [Phycobacter azelaicus]|uniref:Yip1 family protein n=1 Tax=Phycobacter azelaicus TaxID=2668075 RepID=UPI00186901B0|nr:Yip1 family protein [Phycobacter azelaicus]MBE1295213.1 YIP1 family protein [Paracoccaceae bacterium]